MHKSLFNFHFLVPPAVFPSCYRPEEVVTAALLARWDSHVWENTLIWLRKRSAVCFDLAFPHDVKVSLRRSVRFNCVIVVSDGRLLVHYLVWGGGDQNQELTLADSAGAGLAEVSAFSRNNQGSWRPLYHLIKIKKPMSSRCARSTLVTY